MSSFSSGPYVFPVNLVENITNIYNGSGSSGSGSSGPVTGTSNFFVQQQLDAQGYITDTVGDLILTSSTSNVTVSGSLNVLGTLNSSGSINMLSGALTAASVVLGSTKIMNYANGILQISNASGTNPTSLAAGIQIGNSSSGASLVYDSTNSLRSMNYNQTANAHIAASKFALTNADGTVNLGYLGTDGIAISSNHVVSLVSNNAVAITADMNQKVWLSSNLFVSGSVALSGVVAPSSVPSGYGVMYVSSSTGDLWFSGATGNYQLTPTSSGGGGGGGLTSVGLDLTSSIFTVPNSPLVANGVLTASLIAQTSSFALMAPTGNTLINGQATTAVPFFRQIMQQDVAYDYSSFIYDDDALCNVNSFALAYIQGGSMWDQSGNGSVAFYTTTIYPNHPGVYDMQTGAAATDYVVFYNNTTCFVGGSGQLEYETIVQVPSGSTSAQRFNCFFGFSNAGGGGQPTNGFIVGYSDTINGGNWSFSASAGGSRTALDSGVAVTIGSWYRLGFAIDATGLTGSCYVNGNWVGNITTNVPSGSTQNFGVVQCCNSSVGSNSKHVYIDRIYYAIRGLSRS